MPPLAGCTSVALVVVLLLTIRSTLLPVSPTTNKHHHAFLLVLIPWFVGGIIFVSFLIHCIKHQNVVELSHNGTYCIVNDKHIPKFTATIATVLAITIFVLEVIIAVMIYPHRRCLDVFQQSISLGLQLSLFTAVVFCAAGIGLAFVITKTRGAAFDIVMAASTKFLIAP
ncbi:hypothetical protein Agabi119p4_9873 [Agaricus bisporus var. burnettii]|uniref:Uncharacterized protein n=1 Tax=Agaricus bisporus var. burnettii TaxID=192524 RepID=A0A8H7C3W3_AGABI|nr:hypothetical protein Agabi119p4_9873 [Agaricus bisporus var. burnettii]